MLNSIINIDLHIHSKLSAYKEEPGFVENSSVDHLDVLFKKLDDHNINLFSFTDHNRFDVELYEKALEIIEDENKYTNVKGLLSGVEFDVILEDKDGMKPCHIITIFDTKEKKDREKIQTCINEDKLLLPQESYTKERYEALLKKIGLNTILIVHQKQSLDIIDKTHKSLSGSVKDPYSIIKIGYISALEYQKSAVEGILKNNLKDLEKQVPLFTGSDCHQWKYYPKHDKNASYEIERFTTMKCLPTFKGVLLSLTSPNTRINLIKKLKKPNYLEKFNLGDKEVSFDYGINAIVGENGAGKSTLMKLLNGDTRANYVKRIKKDSDFILEQTLSEDDTLFVEQSEIVRKLNDKQLFDSSFYEEVDNSEFKTAYQEFDKKLKRFIEHNVTLNEMYKKLDNTKIVIDPEMEISTFFLQIDTTTLKLQNTNDVNERKESLKTILLNIKKEIANEYYNGTQKKSLIEIYNSFLGFYKEIAISYYKIVCSNGVKNAIINQCNEYKVNVKTRQTAVDTQVSTYKENKQAVISNFISFIEKEKENNKLPNSVKILSSDSDKSENGFVFKKIAKYSGSNVEEVYMKKMFIQDYQCITNLSEINTKEEMKRAIMGCANISDINEKWSTNFKRFMDEMTDSDEFILDAGNDVKQGRTLGQISLTYYKYHLNSENSAEVICIDQPEDNISNNHINQSLINYLNILRKDKQIIIVTHNPLLIINLDVDNVIQVELLNNKIYCKSGCLEDESSEILKYIAENMDGGKESIERRYKLYD
ncbi:MAG: ATP-binding cassette domain-containing protein [Anaerorhabdus sp.]|uniref:ATP-binding cassette domain-containing protein n=1 Tax=Anaerorhabdus sp. TaxID=1872524 RepID=UPI002FCBAD7E